MAVLRKAERGSGTADPKPFGLRPTSDFRRCPFITRIELSELIIGHIAHTFLAYPVPENQVPSS